MRSVLLLACLLAASSARAENDLCHSLADPAERRAFAGRIMAAHGAEDGEYRPPYLMRAMSALERGDLINARLNLSNILLLFSDWFCFVIVNSGRQYFNEAMM